MNVLGGKSGTRNTVWSCKGGRVRHTYKVDQYEIVLSFKVSLFNQFIQSQKQRRVCLFSLFRDKKKKY